MNMTRSDALDRRARHAVELVGRFDFAALHEVLTQDAVMEFPFAPPPMPSRLEGREGVVATLSRMLPDAFSSFAFEIENVHVSPKQNTATVEARSVGTFHDGRVYRNRYVIVLTFVADRIKLWREYFDSAVAVAAM